MRKCRILHARKLAEAAVAATSAVALCVLAPAASAQTETGEEEIAALGQQADAIAGSAAGRDVIAAPIPISSPSLGTGILLAGVVFYNPNAAPTPWITGGALLKTSNGNWLVGAVHSMSLDNDRLRLLFAVGAGKLVQDYYGIGADSGDRDVSVNLKQDFKMLRLQGQVEAARQLHIGARLSILDLQPGAAQDDVPYPDLLVPPDEADSTFVQAGPVVSFDTRDDTLNPRSGIFAQVTWLLGVKALGSDFSGQRLNAIVSTYLPTGDRSTLAFHAGLCATFRQTPYYGLCQYGQGNDLRGYNTGRYRDRARWALQGEIRRSLGDRFGAVAFAGLGGIAPGLGHLKETRILPGAGVGLRFRPSRGTNINLRLDLAVGRDSRAIYVGIGEAF